ncbi:MAG: hypothetical protein KDD56_08545, partial [Bdellovibrionales bacterium]|nr:hypothetical protein [Bdellovibrionales bacterium]
EDTLTSSQALLDNVESAFNFYRKLVGKKRKGMRRPLNAATKAHQDSITFGEQIPDAQDLC